MTSDDKFATAAHLYVLLRRKCGRVVDTVWMGQNVEYAREVVRIAREQADADLTRLADRFEALVMADAPAVERATPAASASAPGRSVRSYVGSLR